MLIRPVLHRKCIENAEKSQNKIFIIVFVILTIDYTDRDFQPNTIFLRIFVPFQKNFWL